MSRPRHGQAVLVLLLALAGGCGLPQEPTPPPTPQPAPKPSGPIEVTLQGHRLPNADALLRAGESAVATAIEQQRVARSGDGTVQCWFARAEAEEGEYYVPVEPKLWCGPIQVPGTGPAPDWIPIPVLTKGDRIELDEPKVPAPGQATTPGTDIVRPDGATRKPNAQSERNAGPGYLAVLPDDGKRSNVELGLNDAAAIHLRDDFASVEGKGWGMPGSFPLPDNGGLLHPERGQRLWVLRLHVDRKRLDEDLKSAPWVNGGAPVPGIALDLPGGWRDLPKAQLPDAGSIFVVFTLPEQGDGAPPKLVLNSNVQSLLEQAVELPSGKPAYDLPAVLRRKLGPTKSPDATQSLSFKARGGSGTASLRIGGVRLGWQRPVRQPESGKLGLIAPAATDKALLEVQLQVTGNGLPEELAGYLTADRIALLLPGGGKAKIAGKRYDGGLFPSAVVFEVPADLASAQVTIDTGSVTLPALGKLELAPTGAPIDLRLEP
ncbi:hypothetical protein NLX83_05000 [Allokutzneria sp. A3M-2-11 16]|uniref:hypothetical protein n=1 Tax=Allokutzneria sp. A3M-2-11 16 TaxID=2962043 RepID=UPI0020B88E31|nr:hypothetical protein [Allokutzneria sp. A3M-2-11 16]MCP3798611.1 hypothetical protein [Allokutzneria sp. A3M-2-11 16]